MKTITLIFLSIALLLNPAWAQKGIIINSGAILKMDGNVYLKLSGDHNFINHSTGSQFGGTVVFSGSGQQLISGDQPSQFAVLDIDNSAGVLLGNDVSVTTELILNSGILDIDNSTLLIDEDADITGSFSNTTFVNADGEGYFVRNISSNGVYLFPVGDITSGNDYSPAELDFISGTYNNGSISMRVRNLKHADNTSTTNYLNRYWSVQSSGISSADVDVDFTYLPADIVGNEAAIFGGRWSGTSWFQLNPVASGHITGNVNAFGDFTGAEAGIFTDMNDLTTQSFSVSYSEGQLFIFNLEESDYSSVNIYSSSGQLVHTAGIRSSDRISVPFSPAKGLYIVELVSETEKIHNKFVVE